MWPLAFKMYELELRAQLRFFWFSGQIKKSEGIKKSPNKNRKIICIDAECLT